jgi:hypothetical protein
MQSKQTQRLRYLLQRCSLVVPEEDPDTVNFQISTEKSGENILCLWGRG